MDGITNTPATSFAGQTLYYKGRSLGENITHRFKTCDQPVDMSQMKAVCNDPQKIRAQCRDYYSPNGAYPNKALSAAAKEINQERDDAIHQFFDGNVSGEELSDTFTRLVTRLKNAFNDNEYPSVLGLDLYGDEAVTEAFYSDFRARLLGIAVQRNDEEGKQYITGQIDTQRNWKYYNSDYYFQSEKGLSALEAGLEKYLSMAESLGYAKDYTVDIPDYKAAGMDECYNFNSAWSAYLPDVCYRGDADQFMRDYDQVPPQNFQWFYQSGGNATQRVVHVQLVDPEAPPVEKSTAFDPKDFLSATTWASYVDGDGKRHYVTTDFRYAYDKSDRKPVSDLLAFTGSRKTDAAINRFLSSLQVCSKGYYRRNDLVKGIDLRA